MVSAVKHLYEFGPYRLDAAERLLAREGKLVPLTPKACETLVVLVRNRGRVLSKEELLKEIWPDTYVEEATLAQNIFTLRRALGDTRQGEHRYIETIPRRGYRFVAEVRELSADAEEQKHDRPHEPAPEPGETKETAGEVIGQTAAPKVVRQTVEPADTARRADARAAFDERDAEPNGGNPRLGAVVIALVVFAAAALVVFAVYKLTVQRETRARRPAPFQEMRVTRLGVGGNVEEAVVSPDGRVFAYVMKSAGRSGVWVTQVSASSDARQIVAPEEKRDFGGLTFSKDGEYVYYLGGVREQFGGARATLYRVPVFGGPSEKILEGLSSPVTFAPDGARLAFLRVNFDAARPETSIVVARADGRDERVLARRRAPEVFGPPAWSPDGHVLACPVRSFEPAPGSAGLVGLNVEDGAERPLTEERWYDISALAWLPEGAGLVVGVAEQELSPYQLREVSYPEGRARKITNDLDSYQGASLSADASALVTLQTDLTTHVWVAPEGDWSRGAQITNGAGRYDGFYGLSWTPDGRIVYASVASGSWDIWVMNADGTGQKQLTVGARSNYGPSVSPDGRYIVFVSNRAGHAFNVWRMDADGSNPKQLTSGQGENFAHVTPDGRFVVYATVGFAQPNHVWKVPIDGGEPVRLTDAIASWPFVSPDGKLVACTIQTEVGKPARLGLVPLEGGAPVKLFDLPPSFRANTVWTPDGRAVAYVDGRDGINNLWAQPVEGGPAKQLTDFKNTGVTAYDWSRDGRLALARSAQSTSVVLIRDFR